MSSVFIFQAEDGIRDLVRSRGLGDVYKRQGISTPTPGADPLSRIAALERRVAALEAEIALLKPCLLYTSDAADERSSVDLGGRRLIKNKKNKTIYGSLVLHTSSNCTWCYHMLAH